MLADQRFEICMADGKQASFDDANALAEWHTERTPRNKARQKRPRRAVRSARHPVKVEAAGSNPVEGARGKSLLELRRRKAR